MSTGEALPRVSVIVPVYNTSEDALQRCHNSLLAQAYPNQEIILVDDGSNPQIAAFLDTLEGPQTQVIHQENGGISSARNTGLAASTGDIVTYVDSDDLLAPCAIEQAVSLFQSGSYDMVIGFAHFSNNLQQDPNEHIEGYSGQLIDVTPDALLSYHLQGSLPGPWLKSGIDNVKVGVLAHFVTRELALRCPFPLGVAVSEDTAWCVRALGSCKNIALVDSCWYFYLQNPLSITHTSRPNCVNDAKAAICAIGKALDEVGKTSSHAADYLVRAFGESNRAARCLATHKAMPLGESMRLVRSIMKDPDARTYIDHCLQVSNGGIKTMLKKILCDTGLSVPVFRLIGKR
ncbi:MAG: glycosyltransferase family 2 protein [Eggerthellales bacterium]|nr:glycosyltransferase family 2 protein [Eggerthellales bacterium]